MLQVNNIKKSYTTQDFTQSALDGVSIAFRDNEFVAILGPSGSGKTTMLNIIGGLDQYDSGDLLIDQISTKEYKDRDWDTYRNNRIGFVFQSYNLIPHQTVLANVELALTLSGVSKTERHQKAVDALKQVGLKDHIKKKPNQLSGGQMQRVAIARALINDPEILLADEPTGALDTQTSGQVMELLTQIAKDRLVIMVTHNPELATTYANRIINLKDGQVVSDTRPFDPEQELWRESRSSCRSSMSFITALSLSFSNLMTKKGRTFVTSLAGSIGIIGIALILALANGIDGYIRNIEEETLSIYPLTIQSSGLDLSAMFDHSGRNDATNVSNQAATEINPERTIREQRIVQRMFATRNNNDLASLKEYFIEIHDEIYPLVNAIQYMFDITPHIYLKDSSTSIEQVNPDGIMASAGIGANSGLASMLGLGGGAGINTFTEMLGDISLFEYQFDVVAGRWPERYDELVLILSPGGRVSDFTLYSMGIRDRSELRQIMDSFMNHTDEEITFSQDTGRYRPEELLLAEFKVVVPARMYQFDEQFEVWVDRSNDTTFMRQLLEEATTLRIVGIMQQAEGVTATSLQPGISYLPSLVTYLMEEATQTQIVQDQLSNPRINVKTGISFVQEQEENRSSFDFSRIISVDEEMLREAFAIDTSAFEMDPTMFDFDFSAMNIDLSKLQNMMDLSNLINMDLTMDFGNIDLSQIGDVTEIPLPPFDANDITDAIDGVISVNPDVMSNMISSLITGFLSTITDPSLFLDQAALTAAFQAYLVSPEAQAIIQQGLSDLIDMNVVQEELTAAIQNYLQTAMQAYLSSVLESIQIAIQNQMNMVMREIQTQLQAQMEGQIHTLLSAVTAEIQKQMQTSMTDIGEQIAGQMQGVMEQIGSMISEQMQGLDFSTMADAFQMNMDDEVLLELMNTVLNPVESSLERNLSQLGFADPMVPSQINIFPRNFDSKQQVVDILDRYNALMEAQEQPERVIRYTDFIGAMMSSVTSIIGMVTVALIAFVAISLVVSSIMIGVITYISVLERKKEIGILRAIGASKRNIKQVFNAETLIVGFVAGILGVTVTIVIAFIGSAIVWHRWQIPNIAHLPANAAVILICVSMFLTYISGLIPSSAAARKDPVEALRSE